MKKSIIALITYLFLLIASVKVYGNSMDCPCHPLPRRTLPQYIIAYGSLMEKASKEQTDPSSQENLPVSVEDYRRGWLAKGISSGLSMTYLGVIKKPGAWFNGAIFQLTKIDSLKKYDKREKYYCRVKLPTSVIHRLDQQRLPKGEFWIYALKPEFRASPSTRYPIVQSYVDIFLSGCLEIEEKFQLKGFAKNCIRTTDDWSIYWVNDRIYPRRPFVYQPKAPAIDALLKQYTKPPFLPD